MVQAADFFVSYTSADRAWAEWIAWQLETRATRSSSKPGTSARVVTGPEMQAPRPPSGSWWCGWPPAYRRCGVVAR